MSRSRVIGSILKRNKAHLNKISSNLKETASRRVISSSSSSSSLASSTVTRTAFYGFKSLFKWPPPMSDEEWLQEFEKYKNSPEYKRVNKGISIEDFKFIYWTEYAYHIWGRGLGIIFALPFSYFLLKGYITLGLGLRLSALFALGAGQGFIGWSMVKSGLKRPLLDWSFCCYA